jgi:hypothetical protein
MSRDDETTKLIWYYRHTQLARRRWTAKDVGTCSLINSRVFRLGQNCRFEQSYHGSGDSEYIYK